MHTLALALTPNPNRLGAIKKFLAVDRNSAKSYMRQFAEMDKEK